MKVGYIRSLNALIYDVLRKTYTDMTTLHLVYEMGDLIIKNVKKVIHQHERKTKIDFISFSR